MEDADGFYTKNWHGKHAIEQTLDNNSQDKFEKADLGERDIC